MSNQALQTGAGPADRPPIELPHPVRMRVLGAVMVGVFLGARVGTRALSKLPARELQAGFAFLLLFIGARMVWDALRGGA